jgi:hypothetical protein
MNAISIIGSGNMAAAIGTRELGVPADRRRSSQGRARREGTQARSSATSSFAIRDAFFAGDSGEAKAQVAALLQSLGFRPLDAEGLETAHALEWAGLLLVGLARNGADFDLALGADTR